MPNIHIVRHRGCVGDHGDARPRSSSNPARYRQERQPHHRRAEFFALPFVFKGALPGLPPLRIVQQAALLENVADAVNTRLFLPAGMFSEDAKNRWPFYLLSIVLG